MTGYAPINDPILGRVIWLAGRRGGVWDFTFTLEDGRCIAAGVFPDLCPDDPGWDEIRKHIAWVKENEATVRSRIADGMFNLWKEQWYDEEEDAPIERLRDAITLVGVNFYEERNPELVYDDRGHFDGQFVVVVLNDEGEFSRGPDLE